MIRPLLIACLVANAFATRSSLAEVESVSAVADSTIDLTQPDTAFPSGDLVAAKQGDPEMTATDLQFFYTQFDLPGGLTGQDISSLNSVQLQLSRSGPDLSLTYHVYGIFDRLDTASVDTYTWNDGIGYHPANDLVRFLTTDEINYYSDPAESAFVGTLSTATPGAGPFEFAGTPQSPTAAANLQDLNLNDTDGRITFYVGVRQNFVVTPLNTFASVEHSALTGPTLVLDFVRVPKPAAGSWVGFLLGKPGVGSAATEIPVHQTTGLQNGRRRGHSKPDATVRPALKSCISFRRKL